MSILSKIHNLLTFQRNILSKIDYIQQALGRIEIKLNQDEYNINKAEFRVYSQWGEDGIIQYLINNIEIPNQTFIEFGVERYTESNTRFLLQNNNWSGLVIDGSESNIEYIKKDPIYWKYNLKAEAAFIDKDNINDLIKKNGITGDIGILSVDIDGNDYWVWDAIECISPRIVICEYNSHFGNSHKVSVPYDKSFFRTNKHFSNIYYGASIAAFELLGQMKGYSLICSNSTGNNIFFVRNDLIGNLKVVSAQEAYQPSQFREARDIDGNLTFNSISNNLKIISEEKAVNVETMETSKIGNLYK